MHDIEEFDLKIPGSSECPGIFVLKEKINHIKSKKLHKLYIEIYINKWSEILFISKFKFKNLKSFLGLITLSYFIWITLSGNIKYKYMIWNLILAWIPLEVASVISYIHKKNTINWVLEIVLIFLWILWILFYPNSPYIITDFIHISPNKYYIFNNDTQFMLNDNGVLFNDDFKIWIDFVIIGIGVWIGYIVGFISLYMNHIFINKKFSNIIGWIFVIIVSISSGFAIYLGRFIRWNSWDLIFNPCNIILIFLNNIHIKSLYFTFLFGVFNFILYLINYLVVELVELN